jgi:hypothetical protein
VRSGGKAGLQPDLGGVNRYYAKVLPAFIVNERRAMKTATDRDAEAIEATQIKLTNQKRVAQPGRNSSSGVVRVREGRGREC